MYTRIRHRTLLVLLGLLTLAAPAAGADLTLVSYRFSNDDPVPHLHLSGVLEQGDAKQVAQEFERLMSCSGALCWEEMGRRAVISLDSPGGSYADGVALADFFRSEKVATLVQRGDACMSACALAFLGGSSFWPTGGVGTYIDRTIEPGARLGFHSPYFTVETAQKAVLSGQLQGLLDGTRLAIADIVETLSRYNVSQTVLHDIISMGADAFYEVNTPEHLFAIRARMPAFDTALLGLNWQDQLRNVCLRFAAEHYGASLDEVRDYDLSYTLYADGAGGTELFLFDMNDRPLNVSGCGILAPQVGQTITDAALYQWAGVPDEHFVLMEYHMKGWSSFAYDGGDATRSFVTQGGLEHIVMPLDYDLSDMPETILAQMRKARGRDDAVRLPTHSRRWPVKTLYESQWSRSSVGAGLIIVEQTGPPELMDRIVGDTQGTAVLYQYDRPGVTVRSGEDKNRGTSYYWIGLRSGNRAATIHIQSPAQDGALTQAQQDLISLIACSVDFEGVHLGCYR